MPRVLVNRWFRTAAALAIVLLSSWFAYEVTSPATLRVGAVKVEGSIGGTDGSVELINGRGISTPLAGGPMGIHFTVALATDADQPRIVADLKEAYARRWTALLSYGARLLATGIGLALAGWAAFTWLSRKVAGNRTVKRYRQAAATGGIAIGVCVVQIGTALASVQAANLQQFASRSCSSRGVGFVLDNMSGLTPQAPSKVTLPPDLSAGSNPGSVLLAQISDDHLNPEGLKFALEVERAVGGVAATLDTGDTLSFGIQGEQCLVLPEIRKFGRYLWVGGNHDAGWFPPMMRVLHNVTVLDGNVAMVDGITVYGRHDPAFTPATDPTGPQLRQAAHTALATVLADLGRLSAPPDIVMVHDLDMVTNRPAGQDDISGLVPLVLYGHHHVADFFQHDGTNFLEAGTVGADGLRLASIYHHPFSMNLLYLDRISHRLEKFCTVSAAGGAAPVGATCRTLPGLPVHELAP